MKKLLSRFLILGLFLCHFSAQAQSIGFSMPKGKSRIDIPFEYTNNLLLVKVQFNNSFPLNFIFDTGAEYTILTKREVTDLLAIPYGRSFEIVGADLKRTLTAHLINNIALEAGQASVDRHSMLVLDKDYFKFEELTGLDVHGILGADLFRRFVVKINYKKKVISLYNPMYYEAPQPAKFLVLDVDIRKYKPYVNSLVRLQNQDTVRCNLLLDTGAGLPLLLNTYTHPNLSVPENVVFSNVGAGLGGMVEGYQGRIASMTIGSTTLTNVISSFQEEAEIGATRDTVYRNGIIGNEILRRYTVVFDYPQHKVYLKPNRHFKEKFVFDKSGLTLITSGVYSNILVVQYVLPDSPAAEVGIRRGDIIKSINGMPSYLLNLQKASKKLRSKTGKHIRLKIDRKGEMLKKELVLRDLL